MKKYLYETHLHTKESSKCGLVPAAEMVRKYRNAGYTGIVITDSQQMGAITNYYTPAEAAVTALQAGADMILMPADPVAAVQGIVAAVESGTLTRARLEESVGRIFAVKTQYGLLPPEE